MLLSCLIECAGRLPLVGHWTGRAKHAWDQGNKGN